jgi:hypothetical protein
MLLHVSNGLALAFLIGGLLSVLRQPALWIIAASTAYLIYILSPFGAAARERE